MSKTALVVDDSKSARFALRKFLEGFNYRVETAESAAEAFKYLANNLPEVIFLDHIMPGVDGFEVLKQVKTDPRMQAVPVVICSSNEGEEYAAACHARGASDVLQKPPSTEQIAGVLANLTNRTANYEATLPPLKAEDYALASTLSPLLMPKSRDASAAMDRLMATIPPKLIPTAHLPSKAPIVTSSPASGAGVPAAATPVPMATPAPAAATVAPSGGRPDLKATLPMPEGDVARVLDMADIESRLRQKVQATVRDNIPAEEPVTPDRALSPAGSLQGLPSFPRFDPEANSGARGDAMEARIAKLMEGVTADIGALRAQITALQSQTVTEDKVRGIAIEAAKGRTNALAQSLEQHLTALRNNLEGVLRAQNDRMQQIAASIRQVAAEEARRALAKSAQDISQRTAETLAKTLAPQFTASGTPKGW